MKLWSYLYCGQKWWIATDWQELGLGVFAGFPEPALSQTASTSQDCEYNVNKTDQELERQPMLEAIPWEPHYVDHRLWQFFHCPPLQGYVPPSLTEICLILSTYMQPGMCMAHALDFALCNQLLAWEWDMSTRKAYWALHTETSVAWSESGHTRMYTVYITVITHLNQEQCWYNSAPSCQWLPAI